MSARVVRQGKRGSPAGSTASVGKKQPSLPLTIHWAELVTWLHPGAKQNKGLGVSEHQQSLTYSSLHPFLIGNSDAQASEHISHGLSFAADLKSAVLPF